MNNTKLPALGRYALPRHSFVRRSLYLRFLIVFLFTAHLAAKIEVRNGPMETLKKFLRLRGILSLANALSFSLVALF